MIHSRSSARWSSLSQKTCLKAIFDIKLECLVNGSTAIDILNYCWVLNCMSWVYTNLLRLMPEQGYLEHADLNEMSLLYVFRKRLHPGSVSVQLWFHSHLYNLWFHSYLFIVYCLMDSNMPRVINIFLFDLFYCYYRLKNCI